MSKGTNKRRAQREGFAYALQSAPSGRDILPAQPIRLAPEVTKVGSAAGRRYAPGWLRLKVLKRDRYRCCYCRRTVTNETAQMDHLIPWPYGMTELENLRTACSECNRKKGRKRREDMGRRPRRHWGAREWRGMRDHAPEENGPVRVREPAP
jgi:hypothetical protein